MIGLLEIFSQRRLAAKLLSILIILLGLAALFELPLAEKPRFDMGKGSITTVYPGATASDIESNITSKIEKELLSISGLKEFSSSSETGISRINIKVSSDNADVEGVYQDVRDALSSVSGLPSGITDLPTLTVKKSYSLDFMVIGISSELPYAELRAQAKTLELALRRIDGIGEVHPIDLRKPEFLISLEPAQLQRYGLTISEIASLLSQRNVLISGGRLEQLKNNPELITIAELSDIETLSNMFVSFLPNIQLKNVSGSIANTFEKTDVYGSVNGHQSILFDLRTNETADVLKTSALVRELLSTSDARLGDDYTMHIGFDLANEIQVKFDIVKNNGLVGLILVLVTLALFLDRRIAFWVAVSIPVCLLGTLILLPMFGQILDAYTLSALILIIGIIVDDAVVVSDKIIALVEQGQPISQAVSNGVKSVFPAVAVSILSTMIAFIPLLMLPGNSGKMMYVIPLTVIIALCFSFLDALFFLPAHLKSLLSNNTRIQKKNFISLSVFDRMIDTAVSNRKTTLLLSVALCAALGSFSYQRLSFLFFPTDGAYLIEVGVETAPELTLDQVWQRTQQLENLFAQTADVASWYGEIGSPSSGWIISLTPANERRLTAEQIVDLWQEKAATIDGFLQIEFDIDGGGPPVGRPVDIKVVGGEDLGREALADDLTAFLTTLSGAARVRRDLADAQPRIEAQLQFKWLNYYGISAATVGETLKYAVEGARVSRIFNGKEEAFFRVVLEDDDKTIAELNNINVRAKDGKLVPLSKLVRWEDAVAPPKMSHFNGERVIRVSAGVDASLTDPIAIFDQVQVHFSQASYQGARLVAAGQIVETKEAQQGFTIAIIMAVLGISALAFLLFDRLWEPLVVLAVIPFGIAGALTILFIHQQTLSFFSIIGMIALIGIMVNNSLVLIWHFHSTLDELKPDDVAKFIIAGAKSRVRPIILTTITTVAGLIPLAYGLGGYDNYMSPMALVVGWGCVISMLVTLTVIPCIYSYVLQWKIKTR